MVKLLKSLYIKPIALLLILLIFYIPLFVFAQDIQQAKLDAERDAAANTSGGLWFVAGCLGGVIGLILSYYLLPNPPQASLLGKSPEYVAAYTDAYKLKAKSIQTKKAWTGCGAAAVAYALCWVILIAAASSSE
jgi:hypothetical protein